MVLSLILLLQFNIIPNQNLLTYLYISFFSHGFIFETIMILNSNQIATRQIFNKSTFHKGIITITKKTRVQYSSICATDRVTYTFLK